MILYYQNVLRVNTFVLTVRNNNFQRGYFFIFFFIFVRIFPPNWKVLDVFEWFTSLLYGTKK